MAACNLFKFIIQVVILGSGPGPIADIYRIIPFFFEP